MSSTSESQVVKSEKYPPPFPTSLVAEAAERFALWNALDFGIFFSSSIF
jgi:hypothetical protein